MFSWSAIRTRSKFEALVDDDLSALALEHYSPTYDVDQHYFNRHHAIIHVSIFPGYVFARLDAADYEERDRVLALRGVCQILHGEVTEAEIDGVRLLLSHGGLPVPAELLNLPAGARIRMKAGPMIGAEGDFLEYGGRGHLVVTVNLLGRGVACEVSMLDAEVVKRGRLRIGGARVVLVD